MRVAIVMGSTSDIPKVEPAVEILKAHGVKVDVRCLSAHRAHAGLSAFIEEANNNGTEVFIAAAGMAAAFCLGDDEINIHKVDTQKLRRRLTEEGAYLPRLDTDTF